MLTEFETMAAEQAGLTADGPNDLGRPTHVVANSVDMVMVAWHTTDPAIGTWYVRRVGWWKTRGLHAEFEPWTGSTDVLVIDGSPAWSACVDLGELGRRIEAERERLDDLRPQEPLAVGGQRLTMEQDQAIGALRPLIGAAEAALLQQGGRLVIAIPRHWPQVLAWNGLPVRRLAVTQPLLLIGPVDAPGSAV